MSGEPWYRTTLRWAQTNLVESDPARYDAEWWREHWRKTRIQGVIVNAGGIVAYYPSRFPLHHRAEKLGDRDLYGEIVALAREEGLVVLARMDSNRVAQDFYEAHPDWICRDINGEPYPPGRQVRHLHRLALLQRVPAGRDARDHRAQPSGRLHRQQLAGPAARQHLLLRPLQGAVPGLCRQGAAARARLGRRGLPRLGALELPAPHRPLEVSTTR